MNAKKGITFTVVAVAVVAIAWFGKNWFGDPGMTRLPLGPPETVVQREAEELRSAVRALEGEAVATTKQLADAALKDDYLGIAEERDVVDKSVQEAEAIKSHASAAAMVQGFVFQQGKGVAINVKGFSFDPKRASDILEAAFRERPTAVKERDLSDRLRSLLKLQTEDKWLDDKQKDSLLRLISAPEAGKKAGLSRTVAVGIIDSYCKENGIHTGTRPEAVK